MERAALLSPSQLVFLRIYLYVIPGSVLSTWVPLMRPQGICWPRVWSRGCWEGAKEGDFINTAFNVRPKNFNEHSKYIFNVSLESGRERGKRFDMDYFTLIMGVFHLLSQSTSMSSL